MAALSKYICLFLRCPRIPRCSQDHSATAIHSHLELVNSWELRTTSFGSSGNHLQSSGGMKEPILVSRCIHLCDPEAGVPYRGVRRSTEGLISCNGVSPQPGASFQSSSSRVHPKVMLALFPQALSLVTNHSPGPTHLLWPGLLPHANSPGPLFSCLVTQLVPHSVMQGRIGVDKK